MGRCEFRKRDDRWSADFYNSKGEWLMRRVPPMEGFDENRPPRHLGLAGELFNVVILK